MLQIGFAWMSSPRNKPARIGGGDPAAVPARKSGPWSVEEYKRFRNTLPEIKGIVKYQWQLRQIELCDLWVKSKEEGASDAVLCHVQDMMKELAAKSLYGDEKEGLEFGKVAGELLDLGNIKAKPFAHLQRKGMFQSSLPSSSNAAGGRGNRAPSRPCSFCQGWHMDYNCRNRGRGFEQQQPQFGGPGYPRQNFSQGFQGAFQQQQQQRQWNPQLMSYPLVGREGV